MELNLLVSRQLYKKINYVKKDLKKIKRIIATYFKINMYSEEKSLKGFRFGATEISKIADFIGM